MPKGESHWQGDQEKGTLDLREGKEVGDVKTEAEEGRKQHQRLKFIHMRRLRAT